MRGGVLTVGEGTELSSESMSDRLDDSPPSVSMLLRGPRLAPSDVEGVGKAGGGALLRRPASLCALILVLASCLAALEFPLSARLHAI